MELITILNRCHRFRGFVYHHARFRADHKSIEVLVRPRKGSAAICSRCHQPAPGYDQLAERRFEFIPDHERSSMPTLSPDKDTICLRPWSGDFSFSFCTPCGEWTVAAAARWSSKKFPGAMANAR